ncbi:MAG: DEAD/DEAH box helicase [Synergistaceae bacterium]|nr:DEAD/DEAH box helicase [Synergistaceae bacterium]
MEFRDYFIRDELLKALDGKNFTEPTPVQQKVLDIKYYDRDMIVRARTGS